MVLGDLEVFSVDAGGGPPSHSTATVSMPTKWTYVLGSSTPTRLGLMAQTKSWSPDGTFNNANGGVASELPVDLVEVAIGVPSSVGVGFGETVSFEPVAQYRARALAYLASVGSGAGPGVPSASPAKAAASPA